MPAFGAVDIYLAREYEGIFRRVEQEFTASPVATALTTENPERVGLIIVNVGAAVLRLAPSPQATNTRGIALAAAGGALAMNVRDDMVLPALTWYAWTDVANTEVYVLSVERDTAYVLPESMRKPQNGG